MKTREGAKLFIHHLKSPSDEGGGEWNSLKGWGLSAKLGKHSAIWGKLGTALQPLAHSCTRFPCYLGMEI